MDRLTEEIIKNRALELDKFLHYWRGNPHLDTVKTIRDAMTALVKEIQKIDNENRNR